MARDNYPFDGELTQVPDVELRLRYSACRGRTFEDAKQRMLLRAEAARRITRIPKGDVGIDPLDDVATYVVSTGVKVSATDVDTVGAWLRNTGGY